jgi:hypothetical protein
MDLKEWRILGIHMPAAYTAGDITFTASPKPVSEGGVYGVVTSTTLTGALVPVIITGPAAGTYVEISNLMKLGGAHFRLVTSAAQAANREFLLVLEPLG